MADLFEEVEEQLRSDRYLTLARKAWPWVAGALAAALLVWLGWWGWNKHRESVVNQASSQYGQALQAMEQGNAAEATRLFGEVSKTSARGYKALALMQLGGIQLTQNKTQAAVQSFDGAAAAAPDDIVGDAARLKSAFALLDTAPRKELEARLTPLIGADRPYRVQAREALAFTRLMAGDLPAARGEFVVLSNMLDAPEGARARAKAAIGLIDSGSAKALAATARAAAALPPSALPPAAVAAAAAAAPGPQSSGPQ